jgi:hypothetical protein
MMVDETQSGVASDEEYSEHHVIIYHV